ncbi:hypothetical protein U370_02330 [Anaplasma marginale str. Dawn]|uniref:hypothetical protein n=1 Tax=Anaplasma marginale TaxID=770 RepID=UPI0001B46442|nr:hypothetical protein [Anaplasma marginale]AGZ80115.1 hypothetical protein U370_02330 [Anaplasma marginale str. Dawn]
MPRCFGNNPALNFRANFEHFGTSLDAAPIAVTGFLASAGLSVDAREVGSDCGTSGDAVSAGKSASGIFTIGFAAGVFLLVDARVLGHCAIELAPGCLGDPKRCGASGDLVSESEPVLVCRGNSGKVAVNGSSMPALIFDSMCIREAPCCCALLDESCTPSGKGGKCCCAGECSPNFRADFERSGGNGGNASTALVAATGCSAGVCLQMNDSGLDCGASGPISECLGDPKRRGAGGGVISALVVIVTGLVVGDFLLVSPAGINGPGCGADVCAVSTSLAAVRGLAPPLCKS